MKRILALLLSLVMLMGVAFAVPFSAEAKADVSGVSVTASTLNATASSVKKKNKKIHKKFKKKIKSLAKKSVKLDYAYVDVTGDKIHELIVRRDVQGACAKAFEVNAYQYVKGKVKRIFYAGDMGKFKNLYYYKESQTLVLKYKSGGSTTFSYFSLSEGKYKPVGTRAKYGDWQYSLFGSYDTVTQEEFFEAVGLAGSQKVVKLKKYK